MSRRNWMPPLRRWRRRRLATSRWSSGTGQPCRSGRRQLSGRSRSRRLLQQGLRPDSFHRPHHHHHLLHHHRRRRVLQPRHHRARTRFLAVHRWRLGPRLTQRWRRRHRTSSSRTPASIRSLRSSNERKEARCDRRVLAITSRNAGKKTTGARTAATSIAPFLPVSAIARHAESREFSRLTSVP